MGERFRARGRETRDDLVMQGTISQNARVTLNLQTFHCSVCLLIHVMKDISQSDMLSGHACIPSCAHLLQISSAFFWAFGIFNEISPVNKELYKPNSATIRVYSFCPSPEMELTATAMHRATAAHCCSYVFFREKKLNQFSSSIINNRQY